MGRGFRVFFLAAALIGLGFVEPSLARQWKPTPLQQAQDYLQIEHNISETEGVIVIWLAPQFFGEDAMDPAMQQVFDQYTMVSIIHFAVNEIGQFQAIEPVGVTVELPDTEPLQPLPANEIPPLVSSILHFLETSLAGGLGAMGQNIKTFVYDGASVDSCRPGKLWIAYLEERYEYDTPVPGC